MSESRRNGLWYERSLNNITNINSSLCPRPDKARFINKRMAKKALKGWSATNRSNIQAYSCACGFWHLGNRRGGEKS